MTTINIPIPNMIRVENTTTYKGHEVKVLYILDHAVAYFVGQECKDFDNETWEEIISFHMAQFFGNMVAGHFSQEWSTKNPTGRELYSPHPGVIELTEDRD